MAKRAGAIVLIQPPEGSLIILAAAAEEAFNSKWHFAITEEESPTGVDAAAGQGAATLATSANRRKNVTSSRARMRSVSENNAINRNGAILR